VTDDYGNAVIEPSRQVPPEAIAHPLGIWLWLLPVVAISLVPVAVVLFAGIDALRRNTGMPADAWQVAGVALGIISGLLIGVGATATYQAVKA
jgi:hypothetical protein